MLSCLCNICQYIFYVLHFHVLHFYVQQFHALLLCPFVSRPENLDFTPSIFSAPKGCPKYLSGWSILPRNVLTYNSHSKLGLLSDCLLISKMGAKGEARAKTGTTCAVPSSLVQPMQVNRWQSADYGPTAVLTSSNKSSNRQLVLHQTRLLSVHRGHRS